MQIDGEFDRRRKDQKFKWFKTFLESSLLQRFESDRGVNSSLKKLRDADEDFVSLLESCDEIIKEFLSV